MNILRNTKLSRNHILKTQVIKEDKEVAYDKFNLEFLDKDLGMDPLNWLSAKFLHEKYITYDNRNINCPKTQRVYK